MVACGPALQTHRQVPGGVKKPGAAFATPGIYVGTAGFEPATPATPLQCATGLRHVPRTEKLNACRRVGKRSALPDLEEFHDVEKAVESPSHPKPHCVYAVCHSSMHMKRGGSTSGEDLMSTALPVSGDSARSFCKPTSSPNPRAIARSMNVALSIPAPSFGPLPQPHSADRRRHHRMG